MSTPEENTVTFVPVAVPDDEAAQHPVESACLALKTLTEYATLTGLSKTAPVRELIVDLVADLMHLCAQSGLSYDAIAEEAAHLVASDCDEAVTAALR